MKADGACFNFIRRVPLLQRLVAPIRPENRTVFISQKYIDKSPFDDAVVPEKFCDNLVVTAKYTYFNFIFKNLFEQFLRIANFYFLIIAIVQLVVPDTPVSPVTSILPLVFVLACTAVKQFYEDYLRKKEDKIVNEKTCKVLKNGKLENVKSKNIQVGDIVKIEDREEFPCDLLLLSSSESHGQCSITTANLDGETNLKVFESVPATKKLNTLEKLSYLQGVVHCQQPITDLYNFVGKITLPTSEGDLQTLSLEAKNLLLRGAKLKNTDYIYGCAVYTGQETKLALNSRIKAGKRSQVERKLNSFLIVFLVYLFVQCVIAISLRYWWLDSWRKLENIRPQWYLPLVFDYGNDKGVVEAKQVVLEFIYFYIILNYIIPISLYVTIELQKFVGSMFFGFDQEIYDETIDERAKANTSDLNEELGQVEYLFCDKTGTLTENVMQFKQCSINGVLYEECGGSLVRVNVSPKATNNIAYTSQNHIDHTDSTSQVSSSEPVDQVKSESFFEVLSLCHTVQIEKTTPTFKDSKSKPSTEAFYDEVDGCGYVYHAASPDEKALVEASRLFGFVFHGSVDDKIEVTFGGNRRLYTVHRTLEFDSNRKCMSVMIENSEGEFMLLCKGAESSVLKKCIDGPIDETIEHVDYYASLGFRTLVIAGKKVEKTEFFTLITLLEDAKQDLNNRERALASAYDEIEQGFTVLGATAVEDKLQEGVKETIEKLREAGINIWVLTGDKEETAVNISYSAGHFDSSMKIIGFTLQTSESDAYSNLLKLKDEVKRCEKKGQKVALVVDGSSLALISNRYPVDFQEVCLACPAVLCCRMTPIQKSEIVSMVKKSKLKPITAAIGDGANDVSMIQEAHVGLGIMGKEGRQASRSSDYAFGKFRFLLTVLLVHGHYFYVRLSILVQYFFYKNIAFITANFYYIFFTAYSAVSIYDTIFLLFYNVTFTSLPIYLYGLFEQHVDRQYLLDHPRLYRKIRGNRILSWQNFVLWNSVGLWHSAVAFFGMYIMFTCHDQFGLSYQKSDLVTLGTSILYVSMMTVNVKLLIETYFWTWFTFAGLAITIIGNWSMIAVYSRWAATFTYDTSMSGVFGTLFGSGSFWLTSILLVVTSLLPDLILRGYRDLTDLAVKATAKSSSSCSVSCCNGGRSTSMKHSVFFNSNERISKKDVEMKKISVISHRPLYKYKDEDADHAHAHVNPALDIDE